MLFSCKLLLEITNRHFYILPHFSEKKQPFAEKRLFFPKEKPGKVCSLVLNIQAIL